MIARKPIQAAHADGKTVETTGEPDLAPGFKDWLRRFVRRHPGGALSGVVILLMIGVAAAAPWLAPYDPLEPDFLAMMSAPSSDHWLGTDAFGRDVMSRLMYGARTALLIGFTTALVGSAAGALLGTVSAYFGGRFDLWVQRFIDVTISFPIIILALAVVAILGPGVLNTMIAITLPIIPKVARVVRSSALVVREALYVEGALAIGAGHWRIISRYMLPNVLAPFLVMTTAYLGQAILLEASLSFLGLGVVEPTPAWGLMLRGAAVEFAERAPWMAIFPGLSITLSVLAFNVLGDSLRDALDPRLRT